jgi:ubiquinone/menaquinone biosynthesis C-methylase UbiE
VSWSDGDLPDRPVIRVDREQKIQIVRDGYDTVALRYDAGRERFANRDVVEPFARRVRPGGSVLDVGCGCGIPVARQLVDSGFSVTGIDISQSMLDVASGRLPQARFVKMDMRRLAFADARFDGVIACYSLIHVPKELHRDVIFGFERVLRPGGALLLSCGRQEWEGIGDFHGAPMFWSHPHPKETRRSVLDAGLEPEFAEVREHGGEYHYWVLARKPGVSRLPDSPSGC